MPIGKDETKEQYYKRMVADLGMMMKLVEKDEKKEKKNGSYYLKTGDNT